MKTQTFSHLLKQFLLLPLIIIFGAVTIIGSGGGGDGTPPPTTYTISGTVSGGVAESVAIYLSGASSNVTTTDNSGNFSFTDLDNGSYTLTPLMANYTFAPASINLTISDASSSSNNFTSTGELSGKVSGDKEQGVDIVLSGTESRSTQTDSSGLYSFEGLANGSYTITPSAAGFTFDPINTAVSFTGVASTANDFTAITAAVTYSISGSISGDITANVPVNITGGTTGSTVSDSSGNYSFTGLAGNLDYTVTPTRTDYTFNPVNHPFTNLVADQTGQDFIGTISVGDLTRYSVSGNVSYGGSNTGVIHILLEDSTGSYITIHGTSIDTAGAYTIRGVPEADYKVVAYMDSLDNGAPNAEDPYGTVDNLYVNNDLANIDITLTDPSSPTPVDPGVILAYPYDQGAAVLWDAPSTTKTNDRLEYEIANSYDLYWDTSPNVGPATNIGSVNVPATGEDMGHYFVNGLTNGSSLYFSVRANAGTTNGNVTTTSSPTTIGATTGGSTVSGTVSFTAAAGDPLYVILHNFESAVPTVYTTRIASAANPQTYTLSGIANGNYYLIANLDMNSNNIMDTGDLEFNSEMRFDSITVNNSNVVYDAALNSDDSRLRVRTQHQFELTLPATITDNGYSVHPELHRGVKRATRVAIVDGQGLNTPVDINSGDGIGRFESDFYYTPKPYVNDPYTYDITYSDGSTEILTDTVNVVLESYATPTAPIGAVPGQTHPTFTWTAPASPPSMYYYTVSLHGDVYWDLSYFLPSTATSVEFNVDGEATQDPLTSGANYWWHLNVVDPDENRITVRTPFQT